MQCVPYSIPWHASCWKLAGRVRAISIARAAHKQRNPPVKANSLAGAGEHLERRYEALLLRNATCQPIVAKGAQLLLARVESTCAP